MSRLITRSKFVRAGVVSVANASLAEGDSGSANMTFTVQLTGIQGRDVRFDYATQDGTGTAGVDYTATSGSGTITAGQTSTTINVPVLGDTDDESDETFTLRISSIRYA